MELKATADTFWAKIYIAGDYDVAKQLCREYVMKGLCINISKVDYIYTMGEEIGICVELIQYPRFKKSKGEILVDAIDLGGHLLLGLHQGTFTIMTPNHTFYYTRKDEIMEKNQTKERLTI